MGMNIAGATSGSNVKLDNAVLDVWSKEILHRAQPNLRFESVASVQEDLSVLPGNNLVFLKFNALTGDDTLSETVAITEGTLGTSTVNITVVEHGAAVKFSEYLIRSSFLNIMQNASHALGNLYARNRDSLVRDQLYTGSNVKYAGGKSSRAGLNTADVFDVDIIRDSVEFLSTQKAPRFGDSYFCFIHPHQARHLHANDDWVNASLYAGSTQIFAGESGRIENVRFIETTQVAYIPINTQNIYVDGVDSTVDTAVAANTATDVYRAIMVGQYAVGLAQSLPVEMRDNGVVDYGRNHGLAYYGIWGAGIIESGHSVILETA